MNKLKTDLREKINEGAEKMLKILNSIILRNVLETIVAGCYDKQAP